MTRTLSLALLAFLLAGCGAVFNPYKTHFQCPMPDRGKCVPVHEAYEESIGKKEQKASVPVGEKVVCTCEEESFDADMEGDYDPETITKNCVCRKVAGEPETGGKKGKKDVQIQETQLPEDMYRRELFREYAGLIKAPVTPMVVPPKVGRVLILSYTGKGNVLYGYRYVYFFLDKPRWILSPWDLRR